MHEIASLVGQEGGSPPYLFQIKFFLPSFLSFLLFPIKGRKLFKCIKSFAYDDDGSNGVRLYMFYDYM